jgi:hypothetical protein
MLVALLGCKDDKTVYQTGETPAIDMTVNKDELTETQFAITFTPRQAAVGFDYAIGQDGDLASFNAGTLAGIVSIRSAETTSVTFSGLEPNQIYNVFARGYDRDGMSSSTSILRVRTGSSYDFAVSQQFATGYSAAFTINCDQNYYTFRYALGTASDKAAFEAGTLDGIVAKNEVWDWTADYFELTPNTDYVFYAQGTDRAGKTTKLFEVPFTTPTDAPDATFAINYEDVFLGQYLITPNSKSKKLSAYIGKAGEMDESIMYSPTSWHGDLIAMLTSWAEGNIYNTMTKEDAPLQLQYNHALMQTDVPLECYVLIYDANKKPCAVRKFNLSTPAYDNTLQPATATAKVSDITPFGATYTITPGSTALGVIYDIVKTSYFNNELAGDVKALRDIISSQTGYWKYAATTDPVTATEEGADPDTDYFLAVFPVNHNGFSDPNWGVDTMVRIDFKTQALEGE